MTLDFKRLTELNTKLLVELESLEKYIFKDAALNRYHLPVIARYGFLFVLFKDNKIIGQASFIQNNKRIFLVGLWIKEENRNKGMGRFLLSKCLTELKEAGLKTVELTVDKKNSNAVKLYEANGFKKIEKMPSFYGPGQPRLLFKANLLE